MNTHLLPSETAKLQQSYLTHQVNFLTKVSKVKQNPPVFCSKCHLSFNRIDLHLHNHQQIKQNTNELEKHLTKSRIFTQNFIDEFEKKKKTDSGDSKRLNDMNRNYCG